MLRLCGGIAYTGMIKLKSGIKLLEEVQGVGEKAKKGDLIMVKLNGWLNEGKQIQNNSIVSFVLGARRIIPGIEFALQGMQIGGVRTVKISPHLGYKEAGVDGLIPANALLIYKIEVLDIKSNR